jgi:hypothetical protein
MNHAVHTSNGRRAQKIWIMLGGQMIPVHRTGEMRYVHPAFQNTIRANDRRSDVPAVLLSRINRILRTRAANDPIWKVVK